MKHRILPNPVSNILILAALLVLGGGLGRAQAPAPIADRLDVYFGETTHMPVDGPVDSFSASPEGVIKVEKSEISPNEIDITGLAGGNTMLTVKSGDRTLLYDVAVSPAPERLYINLNESKRLTFPARSTTPPSRRPASSASTSPTSPTTSSWWKASKTAKPRSP